MSSTRIEAVAMDMGIEIARLRVAGIEDDRVSLDVMFVETGFTDER